jgi:hypothetical protein
MHRGRAGQRQGALGILLLRRQAGEPFQHLGDPSLVS